MLALRRTRTMHRRPLNMDDSTTTRFKFLLVEDDPAMIELESLLLEEAGHTVVALHSSDDALSKIKEHAPDCVLTDIMMPGIDGFETYRRLRALEDMGVIRGYHADLEPSKLGFAIVVFAMVSLKSQAEDSLREFEAAMQDLPEVREVHMLNGEIDFVLKIVSRDLQSFQEFLTSKLTPAPNVASVKTSLTIRTSKYTPGVPLK